VHGSGVTAPRRKRRSFCLARTRILRPIQLHLIRGRRVARPGLDMTRPPRVKRILTWFGARCKRATRSWSSLSRLTRDSVILRAFRFRIPHTLVHGWRTVPCDSRNANARKTVCGDWHAIGKSGVPIGRHACDSAMALAGRGRRASPNKLHLS
jgi:hypothetical protein